LNLTNLELYDNELTGEIPRFIGDMSNLSFLQLHGNNLTGPIPENFTIANLPNVTRAYFHNNNLDRDSNHDAVGATEDVEIWYASANITQKARNNQHDITSPIISSGSNTSFTMNGSISVHFVIDENSYAVNSEGKSEIP